MPKFFGYFIGRLLTKDRVAHLSS